MLLLDLETADYLVEIAIKNPESDKENQGNGGVEDYRASENTNEVVRQPSSSAIGEQKHPHYFESRFPEQGDPTAQMFSTHSGGASTVHGESSILGLGYFDAGPSRRRTVHETGTSFWRIFA